MTLSRDDLHVKIDKAIGIVNHGKVEFSVIVSDGNPVYLESVFETDPGIRVTHKERIEGKKILND